MHACEREAVASSFIGIYGCKLKNKNKGLVEKKKICNLTHKSIKISPDFRYKCAHWIFFNKAYIAMLCRKCAHSAATAQHSDSTRHPMHPYSSQAAPMASRPRSPILNRASFRVSPLYVRNASTSACCLMEPWSPCWAQYTCGSACASG